MFIHFSWKNHAHPLGWSVGNCPGCKQECAVRLATVTQSFHLYGIPFDEKFKGVCARCDFYGRNVRAIRNRYGISFSDWEPPDGLSALCQKLGLSASPNAPQAMTDERLQSFLKSVQRESADVELGLSGLLLGAFLGALVITPLGIGLHEMEIMKLGPDKLGACFLSLLVGILGGAAMGAIVEALLRRKRKAVSMIESTCLNYQLDVDRLEELSRTSRARTRKAVAIVSKRIRAQSS